MKILFAAMILSGALAASAAIAQEHKHEEHKEESKPSAQKGADAAKADSKKCCEAMEKKGRVERRKTDESRNEGENGKDERKNG